MSQLLNKMKKPVKKLARLGVAQLDDWFLKETHRFTITGLSRSGKSMLFTSLMTILKYRSEHSYNCLPLLEYLPVELVESMRIEALEGHQAFPLDEHLAMLEAGQWPSPTEHIFGFKLIVRLKQTNRLKQYVLPYTDVVFEFVDYPGEWITDLPMLNKTYEQWSDSAWAQQASDPQLAFAQPWHEFARQFDFEQAPTEAAIQALVECYRGYLINAKQAGLSLLQPGSFLLENSGFDWGAGGFTPLPAKVTSDVSHPWLVAFQARYQAFQNEWLTTLKRDVFKECDKQIILVDLFAGLNHSKQHLYQLKETLSHLADTFVYGNPNWFSRKILRNNAIAKVAFVGTKMDLLPHSQKRNMLSLLTQLTEGARAKFAEQSVEFEHFLVSAIQATDKGSNENALRFVSSQGQYIEAEFEAIPATLQDMAADEHFPNLDAHVPKDHLARMLNGRGLDRLFQFLLAN